MPQTVAKRLGLHEGSVGVARSGSGQLAQELVGAVAAAAVVVLVVVVMSVRGAARRVGPTGRVGLARRVGLAWRVGRASVR